MLKKNLVFVCLIYKPNDFVYDFVIHENPVKLVQIMNTLGKECWDIYGVKGPYETFEKASEHCDFEGYCIKNYDLTLPVIQKYPLTVKKAKELRKLKL